MQDTEAINLTRIMRRDDIINIHMDPHGGFQLRMRGDILGTGLTVGEAYLSAMKQKNAQALRVAA